MATTIWKGTIAFGLLNVPVKVSAAARAGGIGFNLLHSECKHRISQKRHCPHCEEDIAWNDVVKGYADGDDVLEVDPKDLENCQPASSRVMEISSTVNLAEIDPLLFETSYYLEPEAAGRKGFKLLLLALRKERKAAMATITMHQREHAVVIREAKGQLVFHTLYYESEVRAAPTGERDLADVAIHPKELELAASLLKIHEAKFRHAAYADRYTERVEKMLEAKRRGKPYKGLKLQAPKQPGADITELLKRSIQGWKKGKVA
jgi:DNA end-binding protein Ku